MRNTELSEKYADSIYESFSGQDQATVLAQLATLRSVFNNETFLKFYSSPLVAVETKLSSIKSIEHLFSDKKVFNFLLILAEKSRMDLLPEIVQALQAKIDQRDNVARGTIVSKTDLEEKELKNILSNVERKLGKKVLLEKKVDSSLVGGVLVKVGGFTFDDSLDLHLKKLDEALRKN